MDISKLEIRFQQLVDYLYSNGYSKQYIEHMTAEFNWLVKNKDKGYKCYLDALKERLSNTSKSYAVHRRSFFGIFQKFEEQGIYPDGKNNNPLSERDAYRKLNPTFKAVVDHYVEHECNRLKVATIYSRKCTLSRFLLSMQEQGCSSLAEIEFEHIEKVFRTDRDDPFKNKATMRTVSTIFNSGKACDEDNAVRLSLLFPPIKKIRKNIQYLKPEEIQKVHDVLFDDTNGLNMKDRAIGKMLYYTGMRASDIAGMKLTDIDWDRDEIRLVQKKTSSPLILPLTAVVGNAIYDYISNERPVITNDDHVFLARKKRPHCLEGSDLIPIADKIFSLAGIRQNKGDRRGTHIFRHRFATILTEKDVDKAVISDSLGHSDPKSLDIYLSADIESLRECALSIECFQREEVENGR